MHTNTFQSILEKKNQSFFKPFHLPIIQYEDQMLFRVKFFKALCTKENILNTKLTKNFYYWG